MTQQTFEMLMYAWIALAILLLPVQLLVTAPYGRHHSERWGPQIDNRLGWVVMEIVSPIVFATSLLWTMLPPANPVWFIFALWMAHYLHRSLVYPLRTWTSGKRIPLLIVIFAVVFNAINAGSNGYYLSTSWVTYPDSWFTDVRFVSGLAIFLAGAAINIWADNRLIALRGPGDTGYVIPRGGLFERVSCPNHLGEIIEWTGFAILCWNLPAAAFAIWTATNLGARAWSHHRWYKQRFSSYPAGRKAVIPYIV